MTALTIALTAWGGLIGVVLVLGYMRGRGR
jgi:hypothetical protein